MLNVTAEEILAERAENFQGNAAMWANAGATLKKRWDESVSGKGKELEGFNVSDAKPPHLVIVAGTHGALVYETWLYEIIKKYEAETGEQVSPSLEYADFFKVHIPANPEEQPTLEIHGKKIPVPWEMFKK